MKIIKYSIFFIIVGYLFGTIFFNNISMFLVPTKNTYYVLLEGVYADRDSINKNTYNITNKIIDYKNNKYYVYLGITKDLVVFERLRKIYEKRGIKVVKSQRDFISDEFLASVNQFDLLIKDTNDDDQVLTIEEVVLANYDEIFKKK